MELRNANKDGFIDSIIFTARLPAELVDDEGSSTDADESGEEE
jgi:hypothetical protein